MANHEREPGVAVYFDIDGTMLRKVTGVANVRKYPVPPVDGIHGFVEGIQVAGARIGGVITERSKLRRPVTERTFDDGDLDKFFPRWPVQYTGAVFSSGLHKGANLADTLSEVPHDTFVGMIEDDPRDLIPAFLDKATQNGVPERFCTEHWIDFGIVGVDAIEAIIYTRKQLRALVGGTSFELHTAAGNYILMYMPADPRVPNFSISNVGELHADTSYDLGVLHGAGLHTLMELTVEARSNHRAYQECSGVVHVPSILA